MQQDNFIELMKRTIEHIRFSKIDFLSPRESIRHFGEQQTIHSFPSENDVGLSETCSSVRKIHS